MVNGNKSLTDLIAEAGGMIITKDYNVSEVYAIVNDLWTYVPKEVRGSRADPHRHSRNSREEVASLATRILGVNESYAKVRYVVEAQRRSDMDFYSLQDHDNIDGYNELLKYGGQNAFLSCEYTVKIAKGIDKTIHVGVWGLDFPGQTDKRASKRDVRKMHKALMRARHEGVEAFIRLCEDMGLVYIFNHPPWMSDPKNPLTGKEFYELTDMFPIFEINGDCQKENLFTAEVAMEKNKILVAATDRHNTRNSMVYTETMLPVNTPGEFLQAVMLGHVGIGSYHKMPRELSHGNLFDVLRTRFNGSRTEMYKDVYIEVGNYLTKEWSTWKKYAFLAGMLTMGVGGYALWGPALATPALVLGWLVGSLPIKYAYSEKKGIRDRTVALYKDYRDYELELLLSSMPMSERMEKESELRILVEERKAQFENVPFRHGYRWWERVAQVIFPWDVQPDYSFSDRLDKSAAELDLDKDEKQ